MDDENELPNWVSVSQEHLESIIPKITVIKKEGQAEIKRGLEKVNVADNLKQEADYLAQILSQPHALTYWNDEIVTISGNWLKKRLESFDEQLSNILGYTVMAGEAGCDLHTEAPITSPYRPHKCGKEQRYDERCAGCGRETTICNDCELCSRCHEKD